MNQKENIEQLAIEIKSINHNGAEIDSALINIQLNHEDYEQLMDELKNTIGYIHSEIVYLTYYEIKFLITKKYD